MIAYGHRDFTIRRTDFAEVFRAMVEVENWCREEYFRRLREKSGGLAEAAAAAV